jgi:flagellar motility protein MotE (MotC chaperone)
MEKLIDEQEKERKKHNKLQWFLMVVVIPALFAFAVAIVVASVAGINVFQKAKEFSEQIPFVSSEEKVTDQQKLEEMDLTLTELKAEVKDREAAITELETNLESKDEEIKSLTLEKEQLEMQIDDLILAQEDGKRQFKDIVNTYEAMSAKKAAPIITAMNDDGALKILSSLKPATLAAILEKMNATDAAKYSALLTSKSETENDS